MPIPVQDNQAAQTQPTNNPQAPEPQKDPNVSPAPVTAENTNPPVEDIIARASSVGLDEAKPTVNPDQGDILSNAGFDRNQWNTMLESLPQEQRTQLESAYKSLQSGADKKFQKAADMLKEAQATTQQPWTLDRIQQLTQDPAFVQAAQQYAQATQQNSNPSSSGLTDEEYSNLSEAEQQKFNQLTQNQQVLQNQLNDVLLSQQDEKLTQRYKNYDANQVKDLRTQLMSGQVQATSEHLWKVLDYESAVERAYKLGLQDRQMELGDKINATPVGGNGAQITPSGDTPVKAQGENTVSFFKRLAQYNQQRLSKARGQQ